MSVLDVRDLTFSYGAEKLFQRASMRLFEGDHAVLVGRNGAGKTSLLQLLQGSLAPDGGEIIWNKGKRVGYLDQYAALDEAQRVRDYLYQAYADLFAMEKKMQSLYEKVPEADPARQERLLVKASDLGETLSEQGFYAIDSFILKILSGFGLSEEALSKPIRRLSAGMRAKVIFTKLLLEAPDVLLLDEPTNFLDVEHIAWLQSYLQDYDQAFLVVSHDKDFLRAIAKKVFAIEYKGIACYKGDYDYYLLKSRQRFEQQAKDFDAQQKFIKRQETFIQKNITRASTSNRAKSRRRMLEKLERIEPPRKDPVYQFAFPDGKRSGEVVLEVDTLEIGYDTPLVEPLDFTVERGDRVAITGENGIGKTTLIRTLLEEIPSLSGTFSWGYQVETAYFEQDSTLPEEKTPYDIVHDAYPAFTRKDAMGLLGRHGIDGEKAMRKVATLSGGELTKIRLARLRHTPSNVLILDEPTNHLDAQAKHALKGAIRSYRGTLILVSHEKAFYEDLCDYEMSLHL